MKDIKLLLFKDYYAPRTFSIGSSQIKQMGYVGALLIMWALLGSFLAGKFYLKSRFANNPSDAPIIQSQDMSQFDQEAANPDSVVTLKDKVTALEAQLKSLREPTTTPKALDTRPLFSLFGSQVTDNTTELTGVPAKVAIQNFKLSTTNNKTLLTFELHNRTPGESVEKGYLAVLAKTENGIYSYPDIINSTGNVLFNFERGETFQVARFRMVNAQFATTAKHFQILIFNRTGGLLINQNFSEP